VLVNVSAAVSLYVVYTGVTSCESTIAVYQSLTLEMENVAIFFFNVQIYFIKLYAFSTWAHRAQDG
jgi:hypothetical protein